MKKQLETVRHDYVRYANVWEDAQLLVQGLQAKPGAKHLSIASGGDNALMLLAGDPEMVVAADLNQAQLFLCELKRAAIRHLECIEYQEFIGLLPSESRLHVYIRIRADLRGETKAFWDDQQQLIEDGLVHAGKFERYFRMFAHRILPLIHSQRSVKALVAPKSAEEQALFYDQHWNTWRWRFLFNVFFSKTVMGWLGRDPAFLKQVEVHVGEFIFQKAAHHLKSVAAQDNFILRYNLTGSFGNLVPDYAMPENYNRIRANIGRLFFYEGLAETAIHKYGKFDGFNLSDIFEYMDVPTFRQVGAVLAEGANPGARVCYWNLMVHRNLAEDLPDLFQDLPDLSARLTAEDRGFFYHRFIVNQIPV